MAKPEPKVSIIVPVYNGEKYIAQCIDSIVSQTFTDFECILVDDCSPDRCPQICDEYARKDARIQVIHKRKNEGMAQARKTGFDAARGEYIQFVDGDDWIEAEMTERLYKKAVHGDFDIVYCDFVCEYEGGAKKSKSFFDARGREKRQIMLALLDGKITWATWNKIFHRKLFNGLIFPTLNAGEDVVITPQLFMNADKIGYEYSTLYHYRIHSESFTYHPHPEKAEARRNQYKENCALLQKIMTGHPDYALYETALSRALNRVCGSQRTLSPLRNLAKAALPNRLLRMYRDWRFNRG
ncbi:MAG: glycosyltransferase [Zoogloeaceae bacterium]|nr:glycosyltransferase [Zoogloeaceae bacterium]